MFYGEKFLNVNTESATTESSIQFTDVNNIVTLFEKAANNETLLDLLEEYYNYDICVVTEGANAQYTAVLRDSLKAFKDALKDGRKLYKAGEYKKAKACFMNGAKEIDKGLATIKKVKDDNFGTAFIGFVIWYAMTLGLAIIPVINVVTVPVTMATEINESINQLKALTEDKQKVYKAINQYKNKIESYLKLFKKICIECAKKCDKAASLKEEALCIDMSMNIMDVLREFSNIAESIEKEELDDEEYAIEDED